MANIFLQGQFLPSSVPNIIAPVTGALFITTYDDKKSEIFDVTIVKRNFFLYLFIVAVSIFSVTAFQSSAQQTGKTFTVNMAGDQEDPDAGEPGDDGLCDVDPNTPGEQCTLRAAIQNHNANRQLDHNEINFDIELNGMDRATIMVGSSGLGPLPPVLGSVTIAGPNLPSPVGAGRIELDGSQAGPGAIGLELLGGSNQISFLVIHSFSSHGIFIGGTPPPGDGGHTIQNNFIGTDFTGMEDRGNGGDGIFIEDTPDNIIGDAFAFRNIISGNEGYGIRILGRDPEETGSDRSGAANNMIQGNVIGFDVLINNDLPNTKGGILIEDGRDITVGGSEQNERNMVTGMNNGISVQGSLSEGVKIQGNFIGEDGTGAKFLVGILARSGKQLSIEGNILTNIENVGVDIFLDANGNYNIKDNEFNGEMKIGSKFTFGEGRVISVEYQGNFHIGNGTGIDVEESVNSTINWLISGDTVQNGQAGGTFIFKAAGTKNFDTNVWSANAGVGFKYTTDIDDGVQATIEVKGDVFAGNQQDGINARIAARGEVSFTVLDIISTQNGQNGLRLDLVAGVTGNVIINASESGFTLNGASGLRLVGDEINLDIAQLFIEKNFIDGNIEAGVNILNFKLPKSITENTVSNNQEVGVLLAGLTEARIDSNVISGNGIGILTQDESVASISNNTLTANGNAIVLAGSGTGTPFSANTIFANTGLGIDLGNDGVTPNDPGDVDSGPNNLQNFPVLNSVSSTNTDVAIQGFLNSTPNTNYRLEFFANTACDPSGFGEGEKFLGFDSVTTDASGEVDFVANFPGQVTNGAFITATATDGQGNTSEFAECVQFVVFELADLEIQKEVDQSQVVVGDQVIFTITLTNNGPNNATGISVTDIVPLSLLIDQVETTMGNYDQITSIWSIDTLANGNSAELTITVTATQDATITNTAEVTETDQADPDSTPGNGIENEDDQSSIIIEILPSLSIEQQLIALAGQVSNFVDQGILGEQEGRILTRIILLAIKLNNRERPVAAAATLKVFVVLVKIFITTERLPEAQGISLIVSAEKIIALLKAEEMDIARNTHQSDELMVYPNPVQDMAFIAFNLNRSQYVQLVVLHKNGWELERLLDGNMPPGRHGIQWNTKGLPRGIYILQYKIGGNTQAQKLLIQ